MSDSGELQKIIVQKYVEMRSGHARYESPTPILVKRYGVCALTASAETCLNPETSLTANKRNFQIFLVQPSIYPYDLFGWLKVAEKN